MRGPKAAKLTLSEREKDELEGLVRGHNTPQHLALRGRMILLASAGKSNAEIARDLHTCDDTVRLWRRRWIGSQATRLDDLSVKERLEENPRSGRPPRITAEQTCQLVAIACTPPSQHPTSHWTPRELADEVMQRGIIDQISPRHASRLLKRGLSNRI